MREIKFRAWDGEINLMIYDSEHILIGLDGTAFDAQAGVGVELMQFTGLKDKKGKEIYEGDICNIYESDPCSTNAEMIVYGKSVIRFYGSAFVYGYPAMGGFANLFLGNMTSDYIEVIGNIHENKDLLK